MLRLDKVLRSLLRESVLGFLAIVALALAIAPSVFELTRPQQVSLEAVEGGIVAIFALEYVVSLLAAPDKWAFVESGWRLLDLVVILGPLVALVLPWTTTLGATPALRLLRVVAFSARLSGLAVQRPPAATAPLRLETARITVLSGSRPPSTATWEEVRTRLHEPPVD
ncbi:MAG TPA: ion transporter, partial [Planctomycetota bacterium]|nr:ion transporter [Planctomycetota bacterium]